MLKINLARQVLAVCFLVICSSWMSGCGSCSSCNGGSEILSGDGNFQSAQVAAGGHAVNPNSGPIEIPEGANASTVTAPDGSEVQIYSTPSDPAKVVASHGERFPVNEIFVLMEKDTPVHEVDELAQNLGGRLIGANSIISAYQVEVPTKTKEELDAKIRQTRALKHVESAYYNVEIHFSECPAPSKAYKLMKPERCHFEEIQYFETLTAFENLKPRGLDSFLHPVRVAVIDSGLDNETRLSDFSQMGSRIENLDSSFNDFLSNRHGTIVAGVIAADDDSDTEISGIASRFLGDKLSLLIGTYRFRGVRGHSVLIADAFPTAIETANQVTAAAARSHVVNMSFGAWTVESNASPRVAFRNIFQSYPNVFFVAAVPNDDRELPDGELPAYRNTWNSVLNAVRGVVNECGGGYCPEARSLLREMEGDNYLAREHFMPAGIMEPNLISVGSLTECGQNLPPQPYYLPWTPDMYAPGIGIATITSGSSTGRISSGTSFATPQVSSALAILKSIDPGMTAEELRLDLTRAFADPRAYLGYIHPVGADEGKALKLYDLIMTKLVRDAGTPSSVIEIIDPGSDGDVVGMPIRVTSSDPVSVIGLLCGEEGFKFNFGSVEHVFPNTDGMTMADSGMDEDDLTMAMNRRNRPFDHIPETRDVSSDEIFSLRLNGQMRVGRSYRLDSTGNPGTAQIEFSETKSATSRTGRSGGSLAECSLDYSLGEYTAEDCPREDIRRAEAQPGGTFTIESCRIETHVFAGESAPQLQVPVDVTLRGNFDGTLVTSETSYLYPYYDDEEAGRPNRCSECLAACRSACPADRCIVPCPACPCSECNSVCASHYRQYSAPIRGAYNFFFRLNDDNIELTRHLERNCERGYPVFSDPNIEHSAADPSRRDCMTAVYSLVTATGTCPADAMNYAPDIEEVEKTAVDSRAVTFSGYYNDGPRCDHFPIGPIELSETLSAGDVLFKCADGSPLDNTWNSVSFSYNAATGTCTMIREVTRVDDSLSGTRHFGAGCRLEYSSSNPPLE